jgi:hypothetical protein
MSDERKNYNEVVDEAPPLGVQTPDPGVEAPSANVAVGSQVFELPCGVLLDGINHKEVELTPLTSGDRKTVIDTKVRRNSGKIITSLLAKRIKRIGDLPPSEAIVKKMLAPDRDFCVLMVGKMTVGNILHMTAQCPSCQSDLDVDINVDDIEIRRMTPEDYARVTDKGEWYFDGTLLNKYKVRFKYPSGEVNEAISENARANPIEAEFKLLAKMMLSWNGGKPLSIVDFENLPLPLMDAMEDLILKNAKGPDLTPQMRCEQCGAQTRIQIDLTDFLFRRRLTRNK